MLKNVLSGIALVVVSVVAFSQPSFAQDAAQTSGKESGKAGRRARGNRNERLMKELNLTAEQQTKMKAIREASMAKVKPIQENAKLTDEQKKEQLKPIMKDTMKQMMDVLTPEQKAKLKELREKQKSQKDAKDGKEKSDEKSEKSEAPKP